jgi:catechol 2,3-dioxygenase-like lactoylglutathione lyase family enzyme
MRGLALLAALAVLLAGCSGSDPPASGADDAAQDGAGAHGEHDSATHILAPTWKVGDFWTLESPQQASGPFTHVVSGESGDDWIVDTDSTDTAFFNARSDVSFLGKVRKSDLAGSQGSARVEFLRFPLQQNQSWTTSWDGEPMTVTVVDVKDGKATLQAQRADGTRYAEYTYDSKPAYFSHFAFYAPDGTQLGFEWTLRQAGSGFSSPLVRWTLVDLFSTSGPIPQGDSSSFNVEPGFTDIWVEANLVCTAGGVVLAVGPFTGPAEDRGYSTYGACPLNDQDAYPLPPPAANEQWGASLTSAPTTAGTLELHVFGRTLVQFNAGQAPQ